MTFVHTRNSLASSDKIWTQHTPIAYNITSIYLARAVYTMKTSAISSRYLARGSFDGSLNLTCFPRSPRIVLHGSAPQTDPSRSRHSGSHEIACEARKWRASTRSQIATPIFLRRLRYGVASLSLSLYFASLSFSTSFLRRFALDLNGTCTSKSTRFTAFLLPPSLASRRAILFNFVEAARVVKRLQRVNVVSLS